MIYFFWPMILSRKGFKATISSGSRTTVLGTNSTVLSSLACWCSQLIVASSFFYVTLGLFNIWRICLRLINSHGGVFQNRAVNFPPPALLISRNGFRALIGAGQKRHHLGGHRGATKPQEVFPTAIWAAFLADCHSSFGITVFMLLALTCHSKFG